jgi:pimeloyl-ACP methyl ester carboxylesterase
MADLETVDVVLLPSLGRPASDFEHLAARLTAAGFRPLPVDLPPEVPGEPNLHDLASIVVATVDASGIDRFHLVGHAFGNRLARTVTADHPERVASLTLLAAGGYVEMEPTIARSLLACFDPALSDAEHLHHVRQAFFAPGHDPSVWADGWDQGQAGYQRSAVVRTPLEDWWDAVAPRVLVVQALQDAVAVPANGRRYAADHPDVAQLVEIDGAGHALVVEQPDAVSDALLAFLAATSSPV